ncbi:MAG: hypothetical protein ACI4R9_00185 [Kiritimatiellia bacterium]
MGDTLLWLLRIIAVVALLGAAAALATPPGRLPLALRGLQRFLHRDRGRPPAPGGEPVPWGRRLLAFVLVLLAAVLGMV